MLYGIEDETYKIEDWVIHSTDKNAVRKSWKTRREKASAHREDLLATLKSDNKVNNLLVINASELYQESVFGHLLLVGVPAS